MSSNKPPNLSGPYLLWEQLPYSCRLSKLCCRICLPCCSLGQVGQTIIRGEFDFNQLAQRLFELEGDISALARRGSGSACRSVLGGFVRWHMGKNTFFIVWNRWHMGKKTIFLLYWIGGTWATARTGRTASPPRSSLQVTGLAWGSSSLWWVVKYKNYLRENLLLDATAYHGIFFGVGQRQQKEHSKQRWDER